MRTEWPGRPVEVGVVLSKKDFAKAAKGLPHLLFPDPSADILYLEKQDVGYREKRRCIVSRKDGNVFVSYIK